MSQSVKNISKIESRDAGDAQTAGNKDKQFSQAEVEKLLSERLKRERRNNESLSILKDMLTHLQKGGYLNSDSISGLAEELASILTTALSERKAKSARGQDGRQVSENAAKRPDDKLTEKSLPDMRPAGKQVDAVGPFCPITDHDQTPAGKAASGGNSLSVSQGASDQPENKTPLTGLPLNTKAMQAIPNHGSAGGFGNRAVQPMTGGGTANPIPLLSSQTDANFDTGPEKTGAVAVGEAGEFLRTHPDVDLTALMNDSAFRAFIDGRTGSLSEIYDQFMQFMRTLSQSGQAAKYRAAGRMLASTGFSNGNPSSSGDYSNILTNRQMEMAKQAGMSYREYAELLNDAPSGIAEKK